MQILHNRDFWAGLLCLVSGLLTIVGSANYQIGTLENIGPAAYPMAIGVLLALVGVIILLNSKTPSVNDGPVGATEEEDEGAPWGDRIRLWAAVFGGVLLFIYLGRNFGFIPATLALIFVSSLGDKRNSLKTSLLLTVLATAAVIIIFHYLIGLQFSLLS